MEKRQLRALLLSREDCGCDCRGFCEPETCACSLAGIKCQMDRSNFPCSCSQDSCGNSQGRSEFNPGRVKTHYLHTAMRMHLERRLPAGAANNQKDQREVPGQCVFPDTREDGCPFGFSTEEEGGLLFASVPPTTSTPSTAFHLIPEQSEVEEQNSSRRGGDMMDSPPSSALDEAEGGTPRCQPQDTNETGHLACVPSTVDSQCTNCTAVEDDPTRTTGPPLPLQHISSTGPLPTSSTSDPASPLCESRTVDTLQDDATRTPSPASSSSSTDYLDENANEATDFFGEDSLKEFPHAALFSANYSSSSSSSNGYVDLSVSSDSDLEFFDSDYLTCGGPLHNSFKGRGHPDSLRHLQILTSCSLPQHPETPVCLLESLIGSSSEPITEEAHMVTYSQLLEVLQ